MRKITTLLAAPNGRLLLNTIIIIVLLAIFWNQFDYRKWTLLSALCIFPLLMEFFFKFQMYEPGNWSSSVYVMRFIYIGMSVGIAGVFGYVALNSASYSPTEFALLVVFDGVLTFTLAWRWFSFFWNRRYVTDKISSEY